MLVLGIEAILGRKLPEGAKEAANRAASALFLFAFLKIFQSDVAGSFSDGGLPLSSLATQAVLPSFVLGLLVSRLFSRSTPPDGHAGPAEGSKSSRESGSKFRWPWTQRPK